MGGSSAISLRLLLVDESDERRARLRDLLARTRWAGCAIAEGPLEPEALSRHAPERIDCVLVDEGELDAKGLERLSMIGRGRAPAGPPAVVIVSSDRLDLARRAFELGADECVLKDSMYPLSLERAISTAIERRALRRELSRLRSSLETRRRDLEACERQYYEVVKHSASAILVVDGDRLIRFVNAAAETLLGHKAARLLGQRLTFELSLRHPVAVDLESDPEGRDPARLEAVASRIVWDGRPAYLVSLRDRTGGGEPHLMDTTIVSSLTRELLTPLDELRRALQSLSVSASSVLTDAHRSWLEAATLGAGRLANTVNQLIDFSTIQCGKLEIDFREIELLPILEASVGEVVREATSRSISLAANAPARLPSIYADAGRVAQILRQLLSEMIRSTPVGGEVTVAVAPAGEHVEVTLTGRGSEARTESRDGLLEPVAGTEGIGDPADDCGSGLGLSVCSKLVELHGGAIRLDTRAGAGGCLVFTLPRYSLEAVDTVRLEHALQDLRPTDIYSLLIVDLGGQDADVARATGPLLARVREIVPRRSDRIIAQPNLGRIVVVLLDTRRDGALTVKERLLLELAREGRLPPGSTPLRVAVCGPAVHPGDGQTRSELLGAASECPEPVGELARGCGSP